MRVAYSLLRYFALFWVTVLSVGTVIQYAFFKEGNFFLRIKEQAVATGWYMPAFYCHVFGSSLILIAGFFQFSKTVYSKPRLHKALGKLYVLGILFFAAPGAYVMTLFINRGVGVFTSFLLQNTLWVIFTTLGWLTILKKNVGRHIKMMRRSYALAFGAVTLRFYIWLFTVLGFGVNFNHNYLIIAFLSWVPNLLVAEWLNRNSKAIALQ
ncbi:DUF2306 domain-containing protein [Mucilaginibacter conchicola]|uniref:DUF2306 domain-containing protein n=1 Tax=Mucilaginibacter conchicola TaxID=2303333 RepID=A0A372NSE3_9SPHI|nr:DUF2306 domain-containing protein [Mucilaginibacter conchicola]RFZ92168.1 DUF2306 domain-containing protein [Mucilaginibacter conchicola]